MQTLGQDLMYALRQLRKNPWFATAVVLTLALGIGATTAIFSTINGVLLRPLPFQNGERLVRLGYRDPALGQGIVEFSVQELADYRQQSGAFDDFAEYHSMSFTLLGWGEPDRVQTGVVSANFFDVLGVKPLLGRTFRAEDEKPGADPAILLTEDYWRSRFGGDPGIVGRNLRMNDKLITVVGVLPRLPQYPGEDKVFVTTHGCPFRSSERTMSNRHVRMLQLFGQLGPGTTMQQARTDVDVISGRLAGEYPDVYESSGSEVPLIGMKEELTGKFRPTVILLLVMVSLVLFIACTNVAGLMVARLLRRQQEVVVRAALGAGRGRIVRQLLTESTLLALIGGLLGVLLAASGLQLLAGLASRFTPRAVEISLDSRVLLFALFLSLLSGIACGIVPALQVSRQSLAGALRGGTRSTTGKHRFRSALVVVQVAASFILLVGAGLTLRSLLKLQDVDAGFQPENVLSMRLALPYSKYETQEQIVGFFQPLLERIAADPRVRSVGLASAVPLDGMAQSPGFRIEGRPESPEGLGPKAKYQVVSQGYFQTLGIPVLEGRAFDPRDRQDAPQVAIVNRALARRYWPGGSPLGQRVALQFMDPGQWVTIVGVVGDVKQAGLTTEAEPEMYLSFLQIEGGSLLFVRTAEDAAGILPVVRNIVHELDPDQPISDVRTLEEVRSEVIAPSRLTALLLTVFAIVAFAITATGISGIVAYSVSERTQEIGIRSALGAGRGQLLALVMQKGAALVVVGLLLGFMGALFVTRLLSSLLFGVEPIDPVTFVTVSLALLVLAGLACLIPARRATRIDPLVALRAE